MTTYGGVEVYLHVFLISLQDGKVIFMLRPLYKWGRSIQHLWNRGCSGLVLLRCIVNHIYHTFHIDFYLDPYKTWSYLNKYLQDNF